MTSRSITFHFDKQAGLPEPTFLRAIEGPTSIYVKNPEISHAVMSVFAKLITRNKDLFKPPLDALTAFSVTLIEDPQLSHPSLKIEPMDKNLPIIHLKKLKKETADLFFKSMTGLRAAPFKPSTPKPAAPPSEPSPAPQKASTIAAAPIPVSTAEPVPATSPQIETDEGFFLVDEPVALPPKKSAEDPNALYVKMVECFFTTHVQRTKEIGHDFGTYLMFRLFEGAKSYDYNKQTGEFTMTFDQPRTFNLTKLPKEVSDQARQGLEQLQNSVLSIPKKIKGKFVGSTVTFEPGALTISWPKSWTGADAQLLEIYEAQNGRIAMVISYGISKARKSIPICVTAQDFTNFVECNISKSS